MARKLPKFADTRLQLLFIPCIILFMHGPRRYTLHLMPNNTYRIKIDNEEAAKGSLYEDWEFEAPKQIKARRRAASGDVWLPPRQACSACRQCCWGNCWHGMLGARVLTCGASRACISMPMNAASKPWCASGGC